MNDVQFTAKRKQSLSMQTEKREKKRSEGRAEKAKTFPHIRIQMMSQFIRQSSSKKKV